MGKTFKDNKRRYGEKIEKLQNLQQKKGDSKKIKTFFESQNVMVEVEIDLKKGATK
jgi:hypothetical protein